MQTSLSTILEPANLLIQFIFLPKLIYFCAYFSYDGFKNGVSLTHSGMRRGFIAKLYAVFYLIFAILSLIQIPLLGKTILAIKSSDFITALTFAEPLPEGGFIFIGLALFILILREALLRFGSKSQSSNRKMYSRIATARKFTNWMLALPLAIGIQSLIGLPEWVTVGIFAFFMYFAPFASPKEIKKMMPVPKDKNHSRYESSSPARDNF
jgi:hypothetical protein